MYDLGMYDLGMYDLENEKLSNKPADKEKPETRNVFSFVT